MRINPVLLLFTAFALGLTACGAPGGGGSSTVRAPASLSYLQNPVLYTIGETITPNTFSSSQSIQSFKITPDLPDGLSFNTTTGAITGIPTAITNSQTYEVTATNQQGSNFIALTLGVGDVLPTITYGGTTTLVYTLGTPISTITPTLGGGATTSCTSNPSLPSGLSLSSSCVISGTPSAVASAQNYVISANNSGGSATLTFNFTVNAVAPSMSYPSSPYGFVRGTTISSVSAVNGGGSITGCTISPSLPVGLSLNSSCVLSGTPTVLSASTSYTVTATNSGGSGTAAITISVQDLLPNVSFNPNPLTMTKGVPLSGFSTANTGGEINTCTASPTLPSGLTLSSSCILSGTPTVLSGATVYTISAVNSAGTDPVSLTLTVNDVVPSFFYSPSSHTFTRDSAISAVTPTSTGGTITSCSSSPSLPAGLTFSSNCVITGTPTIASSATAYTVTGVNTGGNGHTTITLTVSEIAPVISYTGSPYTFTKGLAITTVTPNSTAGTVTSCNSVPTLPNGLALSSTCAITGTPTAITALMSYTSTASNAVGSYPTTISITVNDATPVISYTGTPFVLSKGVAISPINVTNSGGTPVTCTSSPTLPAGLALSSVCQITGTPTAIAAVASYTITATNTGGSANTTISLTVNDDAPAFSYTATPFTFTTNSAITPQTPVSTGGAITSCSASPTLPTGLSLSTACVLSGTPTVITVSTAYTITGTNSGGSSTAAITIAVDAPAPVINYSPTTYTFTKGTAITSFSPANTGGALTSCSVSPSLPAGLSLTSPSCTISGTPTAMAATANYAVTGSNSGGSSSNTLSITVNDTAPVVSYPSSPYTFTKGSAVSAISVTNSGGTIVSCSSAPTLPAGLSLSATCGITGTPTAISTATSYTVTATNTGGSATATISLTVNDITPSFSYAGTPFTFNKSVAITAQTPVNTGGTITSCSSSPTLPTGLALSGACVLSGTSTVISASTAYTITGTNSGGSSTAAITITVENTAPNISFSPATYTFVKGTAITLFSPTNSGGTVTGCSSSPSLPAGLAISSTCAVTGTPTAMSASTNYAITATNTGGSSSATISITVNDALPVISYPSSPYTFIKGTAISAISVTNSGGTIVSCSSSPTLPAGLSLSATCGITGTPSAISTATAYTITATNTGGTATATISITVNDALPIFSYTNSPFTFTAGSVITSQTPNSTGGSITSCSSSPTLPTGLALSSACVLSGTPTTAQSSTNYTITGTSSGGTSTPSITITINPAPPAINYIPTSYNFVYTKSTAISALTPNNTGGTISSCAISPALPTGLSIASATCTITGTPSVIVAQTNYTVTATNSGGSSSEVIAITVNDVAPVPIYGNSPFSFTINTSITSQTPTNTGGVITSCSVNPALPGGLSLSTVCALSGTPTAITASMVYSVQATNSGGSASTSITIQVVDVAPSALSYSPSSEIYRVRNAIATLSPTSSGGTITSCSSSPNLATNTGLTLNANCSISGTPTTVSGSTAYTITASNTGGNTTATLTVQVKDQPEILYMSYAALNGAVNGSSTGSQNIWKIATDAGSNIALTENTNAGLDSIDPSFSPSGATVLFTSLQDLGGGSNGTSSSSYDIWSSTGAGGSATALTTNSNSGLDSEDTPVVSPDGTKVAFASKMALNGSANGTASSSYNIWVMNIDGTGKVDITKNSNGSLDSHAPTWSPDSTTVYFHSLTPTSGAWNGTPSGSANIFKSPATGTGITALTTNTTAGRDSMYPQANSTLVVFQSKARIGGTTPLSYNIWTYTISGGTKTALTSNTATGLDNEHPTLSPDGSTIVFQSTQPVGGVTANSFNIWTMTSTGASQTALTTNTAASLDSEMPSFSTDGTQIVFQSMQAINSTTSNSFNIWLMSSTGSSQSNLTSNTDSGLDSTLTSTNVWYAQ